MDGLAAVNTKNRISDGEAEETDSLLAASKREMEKQAAQRASTRAKSARWDLDVAIFLFVVLILVITLLFQGIGTEIVAPIAVFGLTCVWLVGWQRGRKLYGIFYEEELIKLKQESTKTTPNHKKIIDYTIEEQVQRALGKRWGKTIIDALVEGEMENDEDYGE